MFTEVPTLVPIFMVNQWCLRENRWSWGSESNLTLEPTLHFRVMWPLTLKASTDCFILVNDLSSRSGAQQPHWDFCYVHWQIKFSGGNRHRQMCWGKPREEQRGWREVRTLGPLSCKPNFFPAISEQAKITVFVYFKCFSWLLSEIALGCFMLTQGFA